MSKSLISTSSPYNAADSLILLVPWELKESWLELGDWAGLKMAIATKMLTSLLKNRVCMFSMTVLM